MKQPREEKERDGALSGRHEYIINSKLPLSLKSKVYNHYVLTVPTFGFEICHLTKEKDRRLRSAQSGREKRLESHGEIGSKKQG